MNAPSLDLEHVADHYLAMAHVFSYPQPAAWQKLAEHGYTDSVIEPEQLEAEYLAAFEVGRNGAAVPLFEGMHRANEGRAGILEDLLRFYDFFDVRLSPSDREYPDHLATELEFLAWLCQSEELARQEGFDAEPYRRATRDFLDRHLAAWLPEFSRKLGMTDTVFERYGSMLCKLVEDHRRQLGAAN